MYNYKMTLTACTLFLLLTLCGQPAFAQTATSTQDQALSNDQTFNQTGSAQSLTIGSSPPMRGFPFPGESPLPPFLPTPPHFAPPVTDGNYGSLETVLAYKNQYTLADAEALLVKREKMRVLTSCFTPVSIRTPKSFLRILPTPKDKEAFRRQYELIGIGNYKSKNSKSISEQVLGMAIKEGLTVGADAMLFQEGAALIQVASGWSIGLFNSLSTASAGLGTGVGNVTVGGIGYGKGQSGYESKPWLRVQFFRELPVSARPYRAPARPERPQSKNNLNTYEESLKKPGKAPTPEEAFTIKEAVPEPTRR